MDEQPSLMRQVALKRIKEDIVLEDEDGKIIINKKGMKRVPVSDGQVIVVKDFDGLTTDMVDAIVRGISDLGMYNCIVVVVEQLSGLKVLDEEQMARYGWIRKQES